MYYRFEATGTFIEADSFDKAKEKYLKMISEESEDKNNWHECTCLGLSHRYNCPVLDDQEIPF